MFSTDSSKAWLAGRLTECIVTYKGEVVYVTGVRDGENVPRVFAMTIEGVHIEEEHTDPAWNFRPFPLGYLNDKRTCSYVARIPRRRWKQGLAEGSVMVAGEDRVVRQKLFSSALVDCFMNKYPTFKKVRTSLAAMKPGGSRAFSREFALLSTDAQIELHHRGVKVGWVAGNDIRLGGKFSYLKESLAELGVAT